MLGQWRRGEVVQYSLTLVEGWNFRQVRAALAREERLEQRLGGLSDADLMKALDLPGLNPEGRFFPDTYSFVRGMSDYDLLKQAHARLEQVLAEEWASRAKGLPYNEPYDALIMASMIEKETGVAYERAEIAGVFVRRLRIGMRLQTDPTVIYGMGERYKGRITRADLREPTPYNTYTIDGMPPTPIALVGREAIHAALQAHPSMKHIVIVDDDIDIFDPSSVEFAIATRFQADRDAVIIKNVRGSSLDPSASKTGLTAKVGIDATIPLGREKDFERAKVQADLHLNY